MTGVTQRSLLWRHLKVAWLPATLFAACAIGLIINRDKRGSAVIWRGDYALSLGHGEYRATDRETYEVVGRRARWRLACGAGMVACALAAALLIRRAGLPYGATPAVPRALRPPV